MDPRVPPSGPFSPIARLSISAPLAFSTGVDRTIDFDVVDYIKGDIGRILNPTVGGASFALGPGLYLVQTQIVLSVSTTTVTLASTIETGSHADAIGTTQGTTTTVNTFLNSIVLPDEDPLSEPDRVFAGLITSFRGTGASGNINKAVALIQRLGSPQ